MSHQNLAEAFQVWEAQYRADVIAATWGHLAPRERKTYSGYIVFAVPEYDSGNPCIVQADFKGLEDSPWLYDAMVSFAEQAHRAGVYRFDGTFRNYEFKGDIRRISTERGNKDAE